MAMIATGSRDPANHQLAVLDLDAETTIFRIIPIAGSVLVIACIALLLATSDANPLAVSSKAVHPAARFPLAIPAIQTLTALPTHGSVPAMNVGPSTSQIESGMPFSQ